MPIARTIFWLLSEISLFIILIIVWVFWVFLRNPILSQPSIVVDTELFGSLSLIKFITASSNMDEVILVGYGFRALVTLLSP